MKLFEGYEAPVDSVAELDFQVRWPLDEDGHTVEINQPEQLVFEGLTNEGCVKDLSEVIALHDDDIFEPRIGKAHYIADVPEFSIYKSILAARDYRCGRLIG